MVIPSVQLSCLASAGTPREDYGGGGGGGGGRGFGGGGRGGYGGGGGRGGGRYNDYGAPSLMR